MDVDIAGEHSVETRDGLNDLEKHGKVEDLELYRKTWDDSSTSNCNSGVRVIRWSYIIVVKGIDLFNGEVLR